MDTLSDVWYNPIFDSSMPAESYKIRLCGHFKIMSFVARYTYFFVFPMMLRMERLEDI